MDAQQAVSFLNALRCHNIKVKSNGWVEASCPLAPWTHKHGTDTSPSFGVTITPGGRSFFSCFTCNKGPAEELVQTLELYAKETAGDYDFALAHQLLDTELKVLPLPDYGTVSAQQVFEEWPEYWLDSFQKVGYVKEAYQYLNSRDVSVTQRIEADLRYDEKRKMIVFPYRSVYGKLAGARGRSILPDAKFRHFDYTWQGRNNAGLVWYNELALNLKGPVVVVEGQFDCLRVALTFPKVVANLTARPTKEKLKKLGDAPFFIVIPDRDEAGQLSLETYQKLAKELGMTYKVLTLDEGVKDPAECHPEYLKSKIQELMWH